MVGNRKLEKNQCAFCKGYWKSDCPRLNKLKKKSRSEANIVKSDGNDSDSFCFSLFITPSGCYSDASKWALDTGSTYHI